MVFFLLFITFGSFIIQAALLLSRISPDIAGEPLAAKQLYDAVNVILSLQVACDLII